MAKRIYSRNVLMLAVVLACSPLAAAQISLPELSDIIKRGNSEQKRDALFRLRSIGGEEASRIAAGALSDADALVRAAATSAVIDLPPGEAVAALMPMLSDKDAFVRQETASALGLVGDQAAVPGVISFFQSERLPESRSAAVVALGLIGSPAAVSLLNSILASRATGETEFLRRAAARSIGQIALASRVGTQRFAALRRERAGGRYADLSRLPPLPGEVSDAFASSVRLLTKVLNDRREAADTRREAAFALGIIGDKRSEALLAECSRAADPYLAATCQTAFERLAAGGATR